MFYCNEMLNVMEFMLSFFFFFGVYGVYVEFTNAFDKENIQSIKVINLRPVIT